jgi:hypothetical protein
VLTLQNIEQLFTEYDVFEEDPAAHEQDLDRVVFAVAAQRGSLFGNEPRLVDGLFAAWAICLPFMPQPASYTQLMQSRRHEWFGSAPTYLRELRARHYFTDALLILEIHQLAALVTADDAADRIQEYLGDLSAVESGRDAESAAEPAEAVEPEQAREDFA